MQLKELLIREAVQAKLDLRTRDEVIQMSGKMLAAAGAVEPRYADAMKKVMDDLGPYCVIAPGIALLHARPEDGVIRSCLSLITLQKPIEFGHSSNDPVDLAFALGALDKKSHISALAELAGYLSNADFLRVLRNSADTPALQTSLFSFIEKGK